MPCIATAAVQRDATMAAAQLEAPWARTLWLRFVDGELLRGGVDSNRRKRIGVSARFFCELEKKFSSRDEISSETLAQLIDSRMHRQYLSASRFLVDELRLVNFDASLSEATELRRIEGILSRSRNSQYGCMLANYVREMRIEGVNSRTLRLYLRAAESFCLNAGITTDAAWSEETMLTYLTSHQGHANSLSRFVTHCRNEYGWSVKIPPAVTRARLSSTLENSLTAFNDLLKSASKVPIQEFPAKTVITLLSLALAVPASELRNQDPAIFKNYESGPVYVTADGIIREGDAIFSIAKRWAQLQRKKAEQSKKKLERSTRGAKNRGKSEDRDTVAFLSVSLES